MPGEAEVLLDRECMCVPGLHPLSDDGVAL